MHLPHVVVDGSNIATEGRNLPSLVQLDEAVKAFLEDYPTDKLTVVVDATFGHRIDASEHQAYEEALLAGELVCPPAGAVGRGDAFVLQIADKADAVVFSNDSFQEFHGTYSWLFDEGRLIGGKPVPEVGWVFVARTPVRGPVSRRATKEARAKRPARSQAAPRRRRRAAAPLPPGAERPQIGDTRPAVEPVAENGGRSTRHRGSPRVEPVNEPMPFIEFVGSHPVGDRVEAVVERFSSHGAYVAMGEVQGYVPLKLLGDPPPRSPKEVLSTGERRVFVVSSFDPPRRSVDLTLPELVDVAGADGAGTLAGAAPSVGQEGVAAAAEPPAAEEPAAEEPEALVLVDPEPGAAAATADEQVPAAGRSRRRAAGRTAATKATAAKGTAAAGGSAAAEVAARTSGADAEVAPKKATTKKAASSTAATKKATSKKATTEKAAAKKASAARKATTKKGAPKKTTTKKAASSTAATKKATSKKATTEKAAAKKASAARKATTKKGAPKKATTKKAASSTAATKKATSKKATTKKATAKRAADTEGDAGG